MMSATDSSHSPRSHRDYPARTDAATGGLDDGKLASGLRVQQLTKAYSPFDGDAAGAGVDTVSFEIPSGSFFTLVGPSGCGKTTTLRCVAGLVDPDAGEISIGDTVVFSSRTGHNVSTEQRALGLVPQSYGIWPHMKVIDNAEFPLRHGRLKSRDRAGSRRRAMDVLERLGLEELADKWATDLSGGQQQRLALARALLCQPEILLLDEPLSNLDAKLRTRLRSELKTFQQEFGVTTLYVTHDQGEALALSDHIAVMNSGRIEQVGSPRELYERPASAFAANFIGNANLLSGTITSSGDSVVVQTSIGMLRCDARPASGSTRAVGDACFVCIRPERVSVTDTHPADPGAGTVRARVESSEYLGHTQQLILVAGDVRITAVVPTDVQAAVGGEVTVTFDPQHSLCVPE